MNCYIDVVIAKQRPHKKLWLSDKCLNRNFSDHYLELKNSNKYSIIPYRKSPCLISRMFSAFWTISDPRASFSLVVALSIRRRLELRTQPKLTQIARLRSIECCNPNSLLDGAIERNQILIEFD